MSPSAVVSMSRLPADAVSLKSAASNVHSFDFLIIRLPSFPKPNQPLSRSYGIAFTAYTTCVLLSIVFPPTSFDK